MFGARAGPRPPFTGFCRLVDAAVGYIPHPGAISRTLRTAAMDACWLPLYLYRDEDLG